MLPFLLLRHAARSVFLWAASASGRFDRVHETSTEHLFAWHLLPFYLLSSIFYLLNIFYIPSFIYKGSPISHQIYEFFHLYLTYGEIPFYPDDVGVIHRSLISPSLRDITTNVSAFLAALITCQVAKSRYRRCHCRIYLAPRAALDRGDLPYALPWYPPTMTGGSFLQERKKKVMIVDDDDDDDVR